MTVFAHILLVLTSLAPIAFVQAAVAFGRGDRLQAWTLIGVMVGLVVVGALLFVGFRASEQPVPKVISESKAKDAEPLAFLVSYALPLVAAKDDANMFALVAFAFVMGIVLWQLQVFHVNPLLAMFGYTFFEAKSDGANVIVLSRTRPLPNGTLSMARISEYLWLFCGTPAGGGDGSTTGDDEKRRGAGGKAPPGGAPGSE